MLRYVKVVIAGLVPAIHVFTLYKKDMDARVGRGHDGIASGEVQ
jgi:hypothetical protein